MADLLLKNCIEKKCPESILDPNQDLLSRYIEYLQGITIDEYLTYEAYLRWWDRNKNNHPKDHGREDEDYFAAMSFLDTTMINCRKKDCLNVSQLWKKIIEKKNFTNQQNILFLIKTAKKNTLNRLLKKAYPHAYISGYMEKYTDEFVERFYNNVLSLIDQSIMPEHETLKEIVYSLYENSKVVNMFEFILKCFLLSRITPEEHKIIRSSLEKDISNLI